MKLGCCERRNQEAPSPQLNHPSTTEKSCFIHEKQQGVDSEDSAVELGGLNKSQIAIITLGAHLLHYVRVRVRLEHIILYVGPYHTSVGPN